MAARVGPSVFPLFLIISSCKATGVLISSLAAAVLMIPRNQVLKTKNLLMINLISLNLFQMNQMMWIL